MKNFTWIEKQLILVHKLTVSGDACDCKYFALPNLKGHVLDDLDLALIVDGQMIDFENGLSELRRLLVRRELDLAADHEIGHLLGRRALDVQNIDQPSAAKDCASVGDFMISSDLMAR